MKFYYNHLGDVKMYSNENINCSFNVLDYEPSEEELSKIKKNYRLKVVNNLLQLEKSDPILFEEALEANKLINQKKEELKQRATTATTILELKNILKEFLSI